MSSQSIQSPYVFQKTYIKQVTVYEKQACIQRNALVDISNSNSCIVVLTDLPTTLNPDSFWVSLKQPCDKVVIKSIVSSPMPSEFSSEPTNSKETTHVDFHNTVKLKSLQERCDAVSQSINEVDRSLSLLNQFRDNITGKESGFSKDMLSAEKWENWITSRSSIRTSLLERKSQLLHEQEGIISTMESIRNNMVPFQGLLLPNNDSPDEGLKTNVPHIFLDVIGESNEISESIILEISYLVSDAGWSAEYEVEVDRVCSSLHLRYYAIVHQKSNEVWKDVPLLFSTARSLSANITPELPPWSISISKSDCKLAKTSSFAPPIPQSSNQTSSTWGLFEVSVPQLIECNGDTHRISLMDFAFSFTDEITVVPSCEKVAFSIITAINTSHVFLLPGKTMILINEAYVPSSDMPCVPPGGKFSLTSGKEHSILVTRKLVEKQSTLQPGVLGFATGQIIRFRYLTTIENQDHHRNFGLTIKERIPISDDVKLLVTLIKPEGPIENDLFRTNGIIEKKFVLSPKEELTFPFEFTIQGPQKRIYGL